MTTKEPTLVENDSQAPMAKVKATPDLAPIESANFINVADEVKAADGASTHSAETRLDKKYTIANLQKIEKQRNVLKGYSEASLLRVLMNYRGTVLPTLLRSVSFWTSLAIYVVVRIFINCVDDHDWIPMVELGQVGVIGGFLSFFLVFFASQNHTRFFSQYQLSCSLQGRIADMSILAATALPKERALRIVRYMNSAHIIGYAGLSPVYNMYNYFNALNGTHKLLTVTETRRMMAIDIDVGANAFKELVAWIIKEINLAQKEDLIDSLYAHEMREKVLQFRGSVGALFDYSSQPISFFYIHFVCLVSAFYLPLFAIAMAFSMGDSEIYWTWDVIGGIIVALQCTFVVGLRVLSQKLADPYGGDIEDFCVIGFVMGAYASSNRILKSEFPQEVDLEVETAIRSQAFQIGAAWGE